MLAAPCAAPQELFSLGHLRFKPHLQISMAAASGDARHASISGFMRDSPHSCTEGSLFHPLPQHSAALSPAETAEFSLDREIQNFCSLGKPDLAVDCIVHAKDRARLVSEASYRCLFRACSSYQHVKRLHSHLQRLNLDLSDPIGELLVVAFLKCGSIQDALQVFYSLPKRTVFSWSAVLSHHADLSDGIEVLRLYEYMQEEGVEPNEYTYVALFKACGSIPDLQRGIALHTDVRTRGFQSSPFVANTLVSMYGKCGMIEEAENVFLAMQDRNLVSWNAMISAYVENGDPANALQLSKNMVSEGVNPNYRTFLFVLQACCLFADEEGAVPVTNKPVKVSALATVHTVHKDASLRGLDLDDFVGNALMKAYGKCGSVGESQAVFCALPERNVVSWNTLLSVFVEHGRGEKALRLYCQMKVERVAPDERTLVMAAQACCTHSDKEEPVKIEGKAQKLMCLAIGQGLHADARKLGFISNIFLGNTLVALYGKCGSLVEAENLLAVSQRDVVSWTAMLSGCVEQGKAKEALLLYQGIYKDGWIPDKRTIAIALQACCMLLGAEETLIHEGTQWKESGLQLGQAFLFDSEKLGESSDPFIISNAISLYGKCGYVAEAEVIFGKYFQKTLTPWNMMLSTYVEQGKPEKALELYRQMLHEGLHPDEKAFLIVLQSCCSLAEIASAVAEPDASSLFALLEIGRSLHADVRKRGLGGDPSIRSVLVNLYGKCRSIKDAENIFDVFLQPDVTLWNAMLSAYLDKGEVEKSLQLAARMYKEQINVDEATCVIALRAVSMLAERENISRCNGRFMKAYSFTVCQKLHSVAQQRGFDKDVLVGTSIMSAYGKCRAIPEAEAVFDALSGRSIVSWNSMLATYIDEGLGYQALFLYEKMQQEKVVPDEITLSCLMQASCLLNSKDLCQHIHFAIVSAGHSECLPLATTLIHAYGQLCLTADAQAIFDKLASRDVLAWSALIAGYAKERNSGACLDVFGKMQEAEVRTTGLTFLSVLWACRHAGLVEKGLGYFECMQRDHGITPELEHYVTVLELLFTNGDCQLLRVFLSNLPERPDSTFWVGILNTCQKYGSSEIEELVILRAGHLKGSHPEAYRFLIGMSSGSSRLLGSSK